MVKDELRRLVAQTLDVPIERLTDDASLSRDFNVDSLTILKLICAIENKYGIEIDADQVDLLDNLDMCYRYVHSLIDDQK